MAVWPTKIAHCFAGAFPIEHAGGRGSSPVTPCIGFVFFVLRKLLLSQCPVHFDFLFICPSSPLGEDQKACVRAVPGALLG